MTFEKKDLVKALYLFLIIRNNPLAYDERASLFVNNELYQSKISAILDFKRIHSILNGNTLNSLEIRFSDEGVLNGCILVNLHLLYYEIDAFHDDDYYLLKELNI
jgi:hypothetical protein